MTKSKLKKYLRQNPDTDSKELLDCLTTPELVEYSNGDLLYVLNRKLHRIDGPAVEYTDGYKAWYLNGELHRIDGPAIETQYGDQHWYKHGKRHRIDGPAVEYANGDKSWWVNGIKTDSNFRPLK